MCKRECTLQKNTQSQSTTDLNGVSRWWWVDWVDWVVFENYIQHQKTFQKLSVLFWNSKTTQSTHYRGAATYTIGVCHWTPNIIHYTTTHAERGLSADNYECPHLIESTPMAERAFAYECVWMCVCVYEWEVCVNGWLKKWCAKKVHRWLSGRLCMNMRCVWMSEWKKRWYSGWQHGQHHCAHTANTTVPTRLTPLCPHGQHNCARPPAST
jgi:hypothetical protein